ncbi:MAG: helix-turn-helix domain-containing protein [Pseudohongiella sp.]|uniref:TetR/AcrR family transcriptional regulator n=1 Tax=Pseudohongiella sp. TaxID=1979412 RepID=UPI0034A073B8
MSVKPKKQGRPPRSSATLSRELIVKSSRDLLRQDGAIPSIRKVAGLLGVDAMAIYHYFPSKTALLEAIALSLVGDIYQPTASKDWAQELTRLCRSYLELLNNHSSLMENMLSLSVEGPAQIFADRLEIALSPLSLSQETFEQAVCLLADYLHGFALAMRCCKDDSQITLDMTNGPLRLFMNALIAISGEASGRDDRLVTTER